VQCGWSLESTWRFKGAKMAPSHQPEEAHSIIDVASKVSPSHVLSSCMDSLFSIAQTWIQYTGAESAPSMDSTRDACRTCLKRANGFVL
jgi:hypothetical protein